MHEIWVALTFSFAGEIWSVSLAILGQLWIAALEPFVKPCYLLTTFDLRKGRRRREDAGGQEQPGSSHWVLVLMGFGYPTQKWLIIADHFDALIISFISQYVHIISTIETYWNSIRFVWEISSIPQAGGFKMSYNFSTQAAYVDTQHLAEKRWDPLRLFEGHPEGPYGDGNLAENGTVMWQRWTRWKWGLTDWHRKQGPCFPENRMKLMSGFRGTHFFKRDLSCMSLPHQVYTSSEQVARKTVVTRSHVSQGMSRA